MKIFLFLIFCVSPMSGWAQEQATQVVFDYFSSQKAYDISFAQHSLDSKRKVIALHVFATPKMPNSKKLVINLKIAGQTITLETQPTEPENLEDVQSLLFDIKGRSVSDLSGAQILFDQEVALVKVQLIMDGAPNCDFKGMGCIHRIKALEKLSQHNLYEEDNMVRKDQWIRLAAVQDLLQFFSEPSFHILLKIYIYDGVQKDYDLRSLALSTLGAMTKHLRKKFGEISIADFFDTLMEESSDSHTWMFILDQFAEFETSAPLFYLIKVHNYSNSHNGNSSSEIMKKLKQKSDFHSYVEKYKDRILEEIFFAPKYPDDVTTLWAQTRACDIFAFSPQNGVFSALMEAMSREDFSVKIACSKAMEEIFQKLDISNEARKFENEMIRIILEKPKYPNQPKYYQFSSPNFYRTLAISTLMEINSTHSQKVLKAVLEIPQIDQEHRQMIETYFSQSKGDE